MSPPLVTVLMPVYNAEAFLQESLDSMAAQTLADFELVAVDDGSTDGSPAILAAQAERDPRVVLVSQPNAGVSAALNAGLTRARGEFIARMDADDAMHPERLARQVAFLRAHPALGFCASALEMIDVHGRVFEIHAPGPCSDAELRALLARRAPLTFTHPSVMLRAAALQGMVGYRREFEPCEDMELFGRLILAGRPGLVMREPLLRYRVHGASISGSRVARQMREQEFVRARFYARRDGAELSRTRHAIEQATRPWPERLAAHARLRHDVARKAALFHRAGGRRLRALLSTAVAAAWRPWHALRVAARRALGAPSTPLADA
ncbi:MAG TPA: glycosyltransferase [Methylibium sp.]|nr:glycosyltransferase [Methylibium sp.]